MYRFLSESIKFVEGHAVAQMASVGDSNKSSADQVARRAAECPVDQPVRIFREIIEHLVMAIAGLHHAVGVVPSVDFLKHFIQVALHGFGKEGRIEIPCDRPVPEIHAHLIKFHQIQLVLDGNVHIAGIVGQSVYIGMYCRIQRVVAQKSRQVREHLAGLSRLGHLDQKVGRFLIVHHGHPFMDAVSEGHGKKSIRCIRIRPQKADPIDLFVNLTGDLCRQSLIDTSSHSVVDNDIGHGFLLSVITDHTT